MAMVPEPHIGSMRSVSPFQPERGCHALLSVATTVERLAATVEGQCGVKLGDVDVETDIGIGDGDIGTLPRLLAKLVHDGVFHFVGHKA